MGIDPYKVTQEEFMQHEDVGHGGTEQEPTEHEEEELQLVETEQQGDGSNEHEEEETEKETEQEKEKHDVETSFHEECDDVDAKAACDDVTAKVNEETPANVGDGLVMTAPTQPTPGTFGDSSASTQFEDSMVISATTPQLGTNPYDMPNVEVSEMIDEIVSDINKTEHGPAVTENAEPTSTATTHDNFFSLGIDKTPRHVGELLKEAAKTIRENQPAFMQERVLRNRKIPTQDLKQYQRNSKRVRRDLMKKKWPQYQKWKKKE
ncbi:uncharacterized protein LOC113352172 [Papaver somniferum]|uniref:uncharacterized protein LOC113352172 n=1 Tax=Papaver somniferum TaxID=3469 RepID=UPI000E6FEE39|nr:uncharacterized protein LOC113352172 [Papaver somniferum]